MKPDLKCHLTSDEIIAAVVDRGDLPADARNHLAACDQCRKEVEKIEAAVTGLGETGRQVAPELSTPVNMPTDRQRIRLSRAWGLKPVLGFGFAVCLLVFVLWGGRLKDAVQQTNVASTGSGANSLFEEADRLVENAMPVHYQKIIETESFRAGDDMMDFIVPSIDESYDFMGGPGMLNEEEISHAETV